MSVVRRPCVFGVCCSDFQAFSCSSSRTQWHTCFFSESGKSCNHGFNSWDLEEGKKQTSVLARLRKQAAPSAPLPDSSRGGGESPLPSLVQTSNLGCSDLIYYLLISIQPRRCSPGQRRREVSQSWSWSCRACLIPLLCSPRAGMHPSGPGSAGSPLTASLLTRESLPRRGGDTGPQQRVLPVPTGVGLGQPRELLPGAAGATPRL